jgi:hypothetical protein
MAGLIGCPFIRGVRELEHLGAELLVAGVGDAVRRRVPDETPSRDDRDQVAVAPIACSISFTKRAA